MFGIAVGSKIHVYSEKFGRWAVGECVSLPPRRSPKIGQKGRVKFDEYSAYCFPNKRLFPVEKIIPESMSTTTQELRGMVKKTPEILLVESSETEKHRAIYNAIESSTRVMLEKYCTLYIRPETAHMITAQIIAHTRFIPYITRINCDMCGKFSYLQSTYLALMETGARPHDQDYQDIRHNQGYLNVNIFCDTCNHSVNYHDMIFRCNKRHDSCIDCAGRMIIEKKKYKIGLKKALKTYKPRLALPDNVIELIN
eukprot:UN26165